MYLGLTPSQWPGDRIPMYGQVESRDCGPTCLKMISEFYGRPVESDSLRPDGGLSPRGTTFAGLAETAERIGFNARGVRATFNAITQIVDFPCIAHWKGYHFIVVASADREAVRVVDPMHGARELRPDDFIAGWASETVDGVQTGTLLLVTPTWSGRASRAESSPKPSFGTKMSKPIYACRRLRAMLSTLVDTSRQAIRALARLRGE